MLDPTPVHRDMEAIFHGPSPRAAVPARALAPATDGRGRLARLLVSREGLVGVGFASAALLLGVAGSIGWTAAQTWDQPVATRRIEQRPPAAASAAPARAPVAQAATAELPAEPTRAPRGRSRRRHGPESAPRAPEAPPRTDEIAYPHLTGAALDQALAEDAAITRGLNQRALRTVDRRPAD